MSAIVHRCARFIGALVVAALGLMPATAGAFSPERFLGTWHEVARIEPLFERGLIRVQATYGKLPDGRISVFNRGFDPASGQWRSIQGTARFIGDPREGRLSVTFFPPFSAGLNIVAVAPDYSWAVLAGEGRMFAWLLARTPNPSRHVRQRLMSEAKRAGIAIDRFTFPQ
ncbi:MAG: lipocalin [Bacteroidales bacterium]|nr:lipocalin [Candidatus Methylacidiphilales bacterium]NJO53499.1 lipocalin [Bacteroidales bacterium]